MASATTNPQKRLGDFLNEQQEPFILEVYLLERDYSKGLRLNGDSSNNSLEKSVNCSLNKMRKKKALFPFCKVLTPLLNKLAFHSQSSNILTRDYDQRKQHASIPQHKWINHSVQFSSASSSTVFNSCSCIVDEEGTCNVCNMRWQQQRCIEGSFEPLGKIPLCRVSNADETVNEDDGGMQQRIESRDVLMPKKITGESMLSVAIWNLLSPSIKKEDYPKELQEFRPGDVSQVIKSKRVLSPKTKKLMICDCVRDNMTALPTKDDKKQVCREFMGPQELGKHNCQRTKEWGQHNINTVDGATSLLTMDSIIEWSKFEHHVEDIGVEITDAILECMNTEIVLELI